MGTVVSWRVRCVPQKGAEQRALQRLPTFATASLACMQRTSVIMHDSSCVGAGLGGFCPLPVATQIFWGYHFLDPCNEQSLRY